MGISLKVEAQDFAMLSSGYPPKQWNSFDVLSEFAPENSEYVLDLGCGDGEKIQRILDATPGASYLGVDIADSPEVNSRCREDERFHTYDGVNLPFRDNKFDVVFSRQVFEHVRHQEPLLREVWRTLKPNGLFVGSLSGLEPYHSRSIFNLTPWGWKVILNDSGFLVETIRPGIDGHTLMKRQFCMHTGTQFQHKHKDGTGEFNMEILQSERSDKEKNRLMLQFAGHIIFAARAIKKKGFFRL